MARDYVAVPYEYEEEMSELTDAEFGQLIKALIRYGRYGEPINLTGNARFYAKRVMTREDYYRLNYEKRCEVNRANGARGGRPPKETEENPNKPKETEKTKNKNKEENKDNVSKDTITPLSPLAERSPELQQAVKDWLQYKKERNETYKETGQRKLISEILNNCLKFGDEAVTDVINQSMARNYRGIIFNWLTEKQGSYQPRPQQPTQQNASSGDRLLKMIREGVFDEPEG